MITLTIIILGRFIYGLLNNKPANIRLSSSDIMSGLLMLKELGRVAREGLLKLI